MLQDNFSLRHIGPRPHEISQMLAKVGAESLDDLIYQTLPDGIRLTQSMDVGKPLSEFEFFNHIRKLGSKNQLFSSYIGMGYSPTITPAVIQRNMLENPSWYTSYTPYQAEISQGRLEALLNYQTMVMELTGMEIANASLLDEATAAAESMIMLYNVRSKEAVKNNAVQFFIDENIFPQTLSVVQTRAEALDIQIVTGNFATATLGNEYFGALVQYPAGDGKVEEYASFVEKAHLKGVKVVVAADILSLAILTPPGEWGADVVVGTTQRFGIPMGYGGPHAAYFATKDEYKRNMPGRIIGVSKDRHETPALRMALQTREQHIKREKATSNICTAQALLANMASMYTVYHGAEGLKRIAKRIHLYAGQLADVLISYGCKQQNSYFFDTLRVQLPVGTDVRNLRKRAEDKAVNLRYFEDGTVGISINETTSIKDLNLLLKIFAKTMYCPEERISKIAEAWCVPANLIRKTDFLTLDVFNRYRSETELMRYIKKLERKDISLTHSMISLGSCTMKLNAAVQMFPLSWPEFGAMHPFVPVKQAKGYHKLFDQLEKDLCKITGFDAMSLQPNSGASGEYAGLLVIRKYLQDIGQKHRNIALIPSSAHGTNPASAVMAGMKVVIVKCDDKGNIDIDDLFAKAEQHSHDLAAFMVTYPSTHGVFETDIKRMCEIIHTHGGQVYMDGANMNAQVGLTNPAKIGADVCHLNLHKTFAIPHGGGGPGVGPIGVAKHLIPYLPSHPIKATSTDKSLGTISAAPYGSASILTISYGYIKMLGDNGLTESTKTAILNANYLAKSLEGHYDILYKGVVGRVAHEMILDCRAFKAMAGITEADIAKRLMDYGFHAPTLSFPVAGTLMIEPTESESVQELDRFAGAMIAIRKEIEEIANGTADKTDNVLKNAPHTQAVITANEWTHSYSREKAAFPLKWIAENKFWPSVGRLDDGYGDRNLICSCAPIEAYRDEN